jgi:hypothetical protein
MSYTKGPWIELHTRIDDKNGYQIAHIDMHGKSDVEFIANRRLMAAAPELLEALQEILSEVGDTYACPQDVALKADKAIKKALGE